MTKPKRISTLLWLSTILLSFTLVGCGKTRSTEVSKADPNSKPTDQNDKPTYDTAPMFSEAQLKVGQWIEWKKTAKDGSFECLRWNIAGFVSSGIQVEGRFSRTCTTPDDYMVEHILFRPDTGLVLEDNIVTPNSQKTGPLLNKSIYSYLYGSKDKVEFKTGRLYADADKKSYYPAFQIKNKVQIFLNNPQNPFHAFVLHWTETSGTNTWTYQLNASNPAIEAIPVSAH